MNSNQDFSEIVASSLSVSEVISKMKRARVGSNYTLVKERIEALHLSTEHWGHRHGLTRTSEELFCDDSSAVTSVVKKRIISAKLIPYMCSLCGNDGTWLGKNLVLRLDHINGLNTDHRLVNLRFLCPNCDSQSATYCGRNKSRAYDSNKINECFDCGVPIGASSKRCRACQVRLNLTLKPRTPKIDWPDIETLSEMTSTLGFSEAGRRLGVSDNAIRKHMHHNLKKIRCQDETCDVSLSEEGHGQ